MLILNKDIIKLESVSSTNDFAKELLLKTLPKADITIIDTKEQTKGRGQKGNYWECEKDKNISVSFIIKPINLKPEFQFYLSMSVSLAIVNFLKEFTSNVSIKWPNDIYIGYKKICGILIENSLQGDSINTAIIGIGININQTEFSPTIPNPTSLKIEKGVNFNLSELKQQLISSFEKHYLLILSKAFNFIHSEYLKNLYLFNIPAQFKDKTGVFTGTIRNVQQTGLLEIEKGNSESECFAFKEIEYIKSNK